MPGPARGNDDPTAPAVEMGGARHPALAPRPAELCCLFNAWRGQVPDVGIWAERKVDGFRALWIDGALLTREGAPIEGARHVEHALGLLERAFGEPMFIDGEWQVAGSLAATQAHFAARGRRGNAGAMHVFDAFPLSEWKAGRSAEMLATRKKRLSEAFTAMLADPLSWEWPARTYGNVPKEPALRLVEDRWLSDAAEVWQAAREEWARGGEGLVLKDAESVYERRRVSTWWKVKL